MTYTADILILPRLKKGISHQLSEISPEKCTGNPVKFTDYDYARTLVKV
ncbi:MAG: hypothetical protein HGB33_08040 [Syntrophaceae bacterium]|nr:hypothetical protein [Syntrophaceae bacterium]